MKRLPRSLHDLEGLRAALWIRESTAGQYENFGPDAQARKYADALDRFRLIDSGVRWTVAHSGWKIARHPAWAEMLAAAGDTFDVLVVGYASRFARSLEAHVDARRAFHAAGAAVLFVDEGVLTSDEDAWERWAQLTVEAESYSRRLSKRVKEGLAQKRRRLGEPGGRPPFGFTRDGRPPVLVPIPERIATVRRIFELSAGGFTDQEAAAAVDLPLFTVRGVLTNPIYLGRLRDGTPARVGATIDPGTWNAAAARRAKRASNAGRPAHPARAYGLGGLLSCMACSAPLMGDTGKYRHRDTCDAFRDAVHGSRRPSKGRSASVPADELDAAVSDLLRRFALRADRIAAIVAAHRAGDTVTDHVTLARIERERGAALERYRRDRDAAALERAMTALDAQEAGARVEPSSLSAAEVVAYLRDLPALWADAPDSRNRIAAALFDRVALLGHAEVTFDLSAAAIALGIADGMPSRLTLSGGYGRGERARGWTSHLNGRRLAPRSARRTA